MHSNLLIIIPDLCEYKILLLFSKFKKYFLFHLWFFPTPKYRTAAYRNKRTTCHACAINMFITYNINKCVCLKNAIRNNVLYILCVVGNPCILTHLRHAFSRSQVIRSPDLKKTISLIKQLIQWYANCPLKNMIQEILCFVCYDWECDKCESRIRRSYEIQSFCRYHYSCGAVLLVLLQVYVCHVYWVRTRVMQHRLLLLLFQFQRIEADSFQSWNSD